MRLAVCNQFSIRFFVLQQVIVEFPQLEISKKVRTLVLEMLMCSVRRFLPLEWPLARILNAKGGSNDEHLFQAVLIPGGQNHARNPGSMGNFASRQPILVSMLLSSTAPSSARS